MQIPTTDIQSIGNIAGELKLPVRQIRAIADRYHIRPALSINHVPHFSGQDVSRLADYARSELSRSFSQQGPR